MIVDAEGKVAPRKVQADRAVGTEWIVASGLQAGDKVIVDGLQKVRPGAPVKPVAWQAGGAQGQGATVSAPAAKQ